MIPSTLDKYLEGVAQETAQMSWSGHMSPILKKRTKEIVEDYFAGAFLPSLRQIWTNQDHTSLSKYDEWHERQAKGLEQLGRFPEL